MRGGGNNAIENWFENTFDPKKNGVAEAFSEENLGMVFDPKKNGVTAAFEKFGANTEAAFRDLGEKMARAFDPNQNGVGAQMEALGKKLGVALSDPDTWIFIIGTIASIAALVLSGGTAGPVVVAALGALGPSMTIINNVAQGRPVDPFDIAAMAFAIIPGVSALAGGLDDAVRVGVAATKAAAPAARTAALGGTLAKAASIANRVNNVAVRTGLLAKVKQASDLVSTITKVGNKARVLMKNPGSIKTLLFGQRGWGSAVQLSKADLAQELAKYGLVAIKAGVQIAKIGEGQGLWQIPDINVPLESINWDNPPEDLQYIFELETSQFEQKADAVRKGFEKAQAEARRRAEEAREAYLAEIRKARDDFVACLISKPELRRGECVPPDVLPADQIELARMTARQADAKARSSAAQSKFAATGEITGDVRESEIVRRRRELAAQNAPEVPLPVERRELTQEELLRNEVSDVEEQVVNALRNDTSLNGMDELNKRTQNQAVRDAVLLRHPEWIEEAYNKDAEVLRSAGYEPSQYTREEVADVARQLRAQGMGRRIRKQKSRR